MTKKERARDIKIICAKCGCNEKTREIHFDQFVNKNWQPHASLRFKKWWFQHREFKDSVGEEGMGTSPVVAQNIERIWNSYLQAKADGIA